ncbi:TPA: hypothetical protein ACRLYD_004182 [Pseudomonas aeruginosa]
MNKALDLLHGLVSEVERKTCCHEETHRGGAIWEICDSCGAKWADDEGGKPEFAWPESVEKAREFLATHPAVEQAGGDERAAFEAWLAQAMSKKFEPEFDLAKYEDSGEYRYSPAAAYWKAWQARAALAQPSPASDLDPLNLAPHAGAFNEAPDEALRPEQAEAERPEVVARVVHSNPVVLGQCGPLNANDELMTVAQHAASVARWAEMFNRVEQERDSALAEVERLTRDRDDCLKARLHYATQLGEALARVAELENQDPVAHLRASDLERLNQPGIAGSAGSLWNGPREGFVPLYAAPVAQAQHSVPEGFREKFSQCMELAFAEIAYYVSPEKARDPNSRARKAGALATELLAMLAAAPGKEGV